LQETNLKSYMKTTDFPLNTTHLRLVCTIIGCPPNAGTDLSISGCDLMKFKVWSDRIWESFGQD